MILLGIHVADKCSRRSSCKIMDITVPAGNICAVTVDSLLCLCQLDRTSRQDSLRQSMTCKKLRLGET